MVPGFALYQPTVKPYRVEEELFLAFELHNPSGEVLGRCQGRGGAVELAVQLTQHRAGRAEPPEPGVNGLQHTAGEQGWIWALTTPSGA